LCWRKQTLCVGGQIGEEKYLNGRVVFDWTKNRKKDDQSKEGSSSKDLLRAKKEKRGGSYDGWSGKSGGKRANIRLTGEVRATGVAGRRGGL